MRVDLRKFFSAYEGTPHQLAAVDQLAEMMPADLLDKECDWVVCFEVDGEVDPYPSYGAKGYKIRTDYMW